MTAPIGHNNPPPHEAFALAADDLLTLVSDTLDGSTVETDEQEAAVANLLDQARQLGKDAEAKRKAEKQPHLDAGRAVDEAYKPVLAKVNAVADEIKDKLTPYRAAKQAAKDEAARKARQEAEEREAAARAAMQADAPLEQRVEAEAALEAASKLKVAANKIDRAPTGLRTRKVVEVSDHRAALKWIMARDPSALSDFIDEYARRNAPTRPMDGVTVREERIAA